MDDRRFDAFARSLAGGLSRRRVVAGLAASAGSWLAPRSSRIVTAQSETGAGEYCSCSPPCVAPSVCEQGRTNGPRDCFCNRENVPPNLTASIETDLDGNIVAASSDGPPRTLVVVDRNCPDAGKACAATMTFAEDGSAAPFLVAEAKITPRGTAALDFVGDGVKFHVSFDARTGEIETTIGKGPPVREVVDPTSGQFAGLAEGLALPADVAARLAPLEPALAALVGSVVVASAGVFCPPGRPGPGPTFPSSDDAAAPTRDVVCVTDCDKAMAVAVTACCGESADLACLLCAAAAAAPKRKRGWITGKGGNAMPAPDPDVTGEAGPTPTSTPTPAPAGKKNKKGYITEKGGHAAPAGPIEETVPTSTPAPTATPTPAGPIACGADELPCADRCIPASECPAATCCLSPESCGCVCPDCGDHGAFAPDTCLCACNADALPCAEGCMPIAACPPASCCLSAETCLCTCPDCGPNGDFDPTTCGCTCGPMACPPNFVLDEESCACVCGMTECSPNHVWDREACTCTCVPQECPANQVFDESLCGCVCGLSGCPPNYVFDEANCACICTAQCPPTFVFDEATCSCVCLLDGCPPSLTFTPESCACYCEPPACPPGYVVDQASCTCFCAEVGCTEGQVFDPASCACVGSGAAGAVEGSG